MGIVPQHAGYYYSAYNADIHAHASIHTHNSSLHSAVAEGSYDMV